MEKIFLEQEEAYQTRILNKLYEIEALLSEKYNRTARKDSTHQFEASYQKVKQFFNSFAEILMEEGITYHTLLRCAGVNRLEVREGEEKEKLVGQW